MHLFHSIPIDYTKSVVQDSGSFIFLNLYSLLAALTQTDELSVDFDVCLLFATQRVIFSWDEADEG